MVKLATKNYIDDILILYEDAKKKFSIEGYYQWKGNYPSKESLLYDFENNIVLIYEENFKAVGVITIQKTPDINYNKITGAWLNDNPYFSIHRVAVKEGFYNKGIGSFLFLKVEEICSSFSIFNLRVDTHEDNKSMRKLLSKLNYQECGIINLLNRSDLTDIKRIAYQKII